MGRNQKPAEQTDAETGDFGAFGCLIERALEGKWTAPPLRRAQ
jgi:hypothetical protein